MIHLNKRPVAVLTFALPLILLSFLILPERIASFFIIPSFLIFVYLFGHYIQHLMMNQLIVEGWLKLSIIMSLLILFPVSMPIYWCMYTNKEVRHEKN